MSRLLKEDADQLGQVYKQILSEAVPGSQEEGRIPGMPKGAMAMPHKYIPGQSISVTPEKFKAVTNLAGKVRHTFLSYLTNPDWEAKGELLAGFNSKLSEDARAKIITRFANDLAKHIEQEFAKYPGGIHPGKKFGKGTSNVGFYELSNELVPWVLGWKFEIKTAAGPKEFTLIKKPHLAKWVADQVVKQVLEAQGAMEYIPAEGERGYGSGGAGLGGLDDIGDIDDTDII